MKKKVLSFLWILIFATNIFSQVSKTNQVNQNSKSAQSAQVKKSAQALKNEALNQEAIQDSILYIKNNLSACETLADKRSILYFLGNLQEQLGLFSDASKSYASAAGITAGDAKNMKKVSTEQLVLDAVRSSLNSGDWETAFSYLNSAVRSSKNPEILAYVNLYSVWSSLCKATNYEETQDSIQLLKAYSAMNSMSYVKPTILFTLWYLTEDNSYADELKKNFPLSPETGIVKGNVQIASVPFWYFVPKNVNSSDLTLADSDSADDSVAGTLGKAGGLGDNGGAEIADGKFSSEVKSSVKSGAKKIETDVKNQSGVKSYEREKKSGVKEQLGLFREEKNAMELVEKLRAKNFDAYFYREKRSSGTTYFIVVVDEDEKLSLGQKLKNSGFDCYKIDG